jgi:Flp pilus assembly protein TadG
MKALKHFLRDRSGSVVTILTLTLIPVLGLTGAAVDYSRVYEARNNFQNSADSAVLAAASSVTTEVSQLTEMADNVFNENRKSTHVTLVSNQFTLDDTQSPPVYQYKARGSIETSLLKILKINDIEFEVVSQAVSAGEAYESIEVVLALDITVSSKRMDSFIPARDEILQTLQELQAQSNNLHLSFVPIDDRINIGTARFGWLSGPAPNDWEGCVAPRHETIGTNVFALTDADPVSVPFDVVDVPLAVAAEHGCRNPIVGPTMDVESVVDTINYSLQFAQTGRFDISMAWAWRFISPRWQGFWNVAGYPRPYAASNRKIVVFLSDGQSNMHDRELHTGPSDRPIEKNKWTEEGFENLVAVCDAMKSEGIEIFMFNTNPNSHYDVYAKECATTGNYYITDNIGNFKKAFPNIVGGGKTARLIK